MTGTENSVKLLSELAVDADRISAELAGVDVGTDPFVAAVRATRMPMIITNPRLPDNPVVFANDAFCRLSGYGRDEILGRNCRFLQGPDSDPETKAKIRAAVEAEKSIEIDIRNYRKDGELFWNRLLLAPVNDLHGKLAYFFASQVDVTLEREKLANLESSNAALIAELADRLREQQSREEDLRFTLTAGRFGAWSLDVQSGALTTSSICREIFGRSASDPFTYADLVSSVHPDDRERMRAAVANSLETGADYEIEYRIFTPDRHVRWVAIRGRPSFGSKEQAVKLAGISLDITDRTRAEMMRQGLIDLSEAVRDLVGSQDISVAAGRILGTTLGVDRAGYGSVDVDAETITIDGDWTAPGISSLAGTLRFRDYGTFIDDLLAGTTVVIDDADDDPRTVDTAEAMKSVQAHAIVNEPVIEDGGLVSLFYINSSKPRRWQPDEMAFLREVASRTRTAVERRRAEVALRDLNETLEAKVLQRSQQLLEVETALRQAQKMEAVGQLTGGLAHDFNNLLTGMMGNLELLQGRLAHGRMDGLDRFIAAAQGAGRRAASLTQRLLAFSRRQTLDSKPTDVNRLIAGMEDLVRRTVGPGIAIEVVGAGGLWIANIDAGQLENALLNLCINARDAMPGGGRITIETANKWMDDRSAKDRDLEPGQYLSLCVTDTGTGMSPETIERAFEPFFTTKPLGEGTGLGLSMIYGFAKQSGGQVRICSELGSGTTVCIYLPRYQGEADRDEAAASSPVVRSATGQTVLVVDDEATIRHLIAQVLEELGYAVIGAADGAAGLKILQSGSKIDLLITDVGLPNGMNGRQVADAARAVQPALKVLFITGYAENAAIGNGHLEPGMALLTKPFTMEALAVKVGDMVKAKS